MGNDTAWGVDKSFYFWSRWIIYAIVGLSDDILQNVVEDKALPIYKFFHDVPNEIIDSLSYNEKVSFNDNFKQNYMNYLLLITLLHRHGKGEL